MPAHIKSTLGILALLAAAPCPALAQEAATATTPADNPAPAMEAPPAIEEAPAPDQPPVTPTLWGRNAAIIAGALTPGEVLIQGNFNITLPFSAGGSYPPIDGSKLLSPLQALSPIFEMQADVGTSGPLAIVGVVSSAGDLPLGGAMLGVRMTAEEIEGELLAPTFTLLLGVTPRLQWDMDWSLNAYPPPSTYKEVLSPRVMALSARGNVPFYQGHRTLAYGHFRIDGHSDIQRLTYHGVDGSEVSTTAMRALALSAKIGPGLGIAVGDHSALKVQLAYRFDTGKVGFQGNYNAHVISFDVAIGGQASP